MRFKILRYQIDVNIKGYRTYIAATLMAIFGVLATTDWVNFMANPKAGLVAIGSGILMAVLRTITTTPPFEKHSDPKDLQPEDKVKIASEVMNSQITKDGSKG